MQGQCRGKALNKRAAISTGLDCESVDRFRALLENRPLLERLFTAGELAYCLSSRDPAPLLAGRFAAKEACMKALGTGLASGLRWHDMEIGRGPGGRGLTMDLSGKALALAGPVRRVHLDISTGAGLAVALVAIG